MRERRGIIDGVSGGIRVTGRSEKGNVHFLRHSQIQIDVDLLVLGRGDEGAVDKGVSEVRRAGEPTTSLGLDEEEDRG